MSNSNKIIAITIFLVVIIGVILSVTAAPASPAPALVARQAKGKDITDPNGNNTSLQSDSIPVSSDGDGELVPYDPNDKIPKDVADNGNSAEGDGGF